MSYLLGDIIEIAVRIEREGAEYYENLAANATNPESKSIFAKLAEDERHHERFFQDLAIDRNISGVKIEDEQITGILRQLEPETVLPDADKKNIDLMHPLNAIKLGIQTEKNTVRFYKYIAGRLKDKKAKDFLKELIEEEKRHAEQLTELHKDKTFSF